MEVQGLGYGENKAVNDLRAAAPMAPSGTPGAAGQAPRRAMPQQPQSPDGIFAPTERPGEPMTAGVDWGAGPGSAPNPQIGEADNIELIIRQAAKATGSPHLLRLLDRVVR